MAGSAAMGGRLDGEPGLGASRRLDGARTEQAWLAEQLSSGLTAPQLAWVEYRRPALIYGRRGGDESAAMGRASERGYDLLRRRSGGGAVLAGPWLLGVNLLLPAAHGLAQLSPVESFRWFGRCWQQALREQGRTTRLADATSIAAHNATAQTAGLDWSCFAGLGHGELLDAQGRKLLGLAQYRGRRGVLLSAGLLVAPTPWEDFELIHLGRRPARSAMHQQASVGLSGLSLDRLSPGLSAVLSPFLSKQSQARFT